MGDYDSIELFQRLETQTAFGVTAIKKDNQIFIAFTFLYGHKSAIYKWDGLKFAQHQTVGVSGTDIDAFYIGDRAFISIVGKLYRSSRLQMFFKRGVLKIYRKFYRKTPVLEWTLATFCL